VDLLRNPKYNKGLAFSEQEREQLRLVGLLPPGVMPQSDQVERVMRNLAVLSDPLSKYTHLMGLQERNYRLFYNVLHDHIDELLPIVGSPTVGKACKNYGLIFRRPRGLFLSMKDRGRIHHIMNHWPETRVHHIVVTDGENVLGQGDLGIQGMGVAVSKLALMVACAGITPHECLPVCIDVGTDNEELLQDKFYFGLRHRRIRGEPYDEFIEEFMEAAKQRFGESVCITFKDMKYENANQLLMQHRANHPVYNDDLQGTATVALAGLLATFGKGSLKDQTFLMVGAGEAGTIISDLLVYALTRFHQLSIPEARSRIWLYDSKGLVVRDRMHDLQDHKMPFAQGGEMCSSLLEAVNRLKPSVMIGTSTTANSKAKTFTKEIIEAMAKHNKNPVVFALSGRSTALSAEETQECTAQDAYDWSNGRVTFLGGAQEPPVRCPTDGNLKDIRCAHSVYVYPGVALGMRLANSVGVRDEMFLAAAEALAEQVTDEDRAVGAIYPPLSRIREISAKVAAAVAGKAYEMELARNLPRPRNLQWTARDMMYQLSYRKYR